MRTLTHVLFAMTPFAALLVSSNAGATIPLPDSGSCTGSQPCLNIASTATNGAEAILATGTGSTYGILAQSETGWAMYADATSSGGGVYSTVSSGNAFQASANTGYGVKAETNTGTGVYGSTSAANNTGAGVYGITFSGNLGVGVKGQASAGSTAIWGYNPSHTAGWFDGNVYANGNLQVYGTPYCSGCTAFTNNSDIRLKKDVKPLERALEQVLQLHGVTFEWKDPAEHGDHQGPQRGFIAQDVEKVIPEWVGVDAKGFKTLNLSGLEAMLVESLRTLKSENDALRTQTSKLEDRVKVLESKTGISQAGLGGTELTLFEIVAVAGGAYLLIRRQRRPHRSIG
jgi:hypothetical protein